MSDTRITGDATTARSDDRSTTDRAREEAGKVAEQGRQEAAHVGQVAKSETARLAREAGSEAKRRADEQAGNLAGVLDRLADELDEFARGSEQRSGYLKGLARDGADTTRRTAERLEQRGLDGALEDVSSFARRRPAMFLAAAFGTGLLLGRVTRNADMGRIAREAGDHHDAPTVAGTGAASMGSPTTGATTTGATATSGTGSHLAGARTPGTAVGPDGGSGMTGAPGTRGSGER